MKYFILLASVLFLAQSCSVAPSMRESARSYDWVANTNFSWQSKIDSAISSYPLLLHPSYEAKGSVGFTLQIDQVPKGRQVRNRVVPDGDAGKVCQSA